jgi:hypothetical protein
MEEITVLSEEILKGSTGRQAGAYIEWGSADAKKTPAP